MRKLFFLLLITLSVPLFANDGEIEIIKQNYRKLLLLENESEKELVQKLVVLPKEAYFSDQMVVELMEKYAIEDSDTRSLLASIRADGTWADVDYADTGHSGWKPKKHLEKILVLAKVYNMPSSAYYHSSEVESAIHLALGYWFGEGLISPNWWYNQISVPKTMGAIYILMEDRLTTIELNQMIVVMQKSKFGMTGQNKVWLAGNVLVRGLMQKDMELVKAARDTIFSEIRTGEEEGIKADYSFHQHGTQLQFGNYGAAYVASMSFWSQVLAGTSLKLSQPQLNILSSLINEGYARILWKGYMDVNSLGRQLFARSQRHKAFSIGFSSSMLADVDAVNAKRYKNLLDCNFYHTEKEPPMLGLHHFWMSDMTVQRRPHWMASVKMSSPRVIGAESGNGDNLKGYYLADGALYIYVDGNEYADIFPCWDWRKLPGVTAYETDKPLKELSWGGYHNQSPFVGNVSDGETGITSMLLDRDGLTARKSWVFTPDFVLCLGAGIAADTGFVVTTAIEQRVKTSDVLQLKGKKWEKVVSAAFSKDEGQQRFFHDKTGYIVLEPQSGKVLSQRRTGAWKNVMWSYPEDYTETKDVFSLWLDHGVDPQGASYQYLILPATSARNVKDFNLGSVKVNANTLEMQSVTIGDITYSAVYPLADVQVSEGVNLQSSNTGLFMTKREGNRLKVIVSDPTQLLDSMEVTVKGQTKTVKLPAGDMRGTPVIVYFDLLK